MKNPEASTPLLSVTNQSRMKLLGTGMLNKRHHNLFMFGSLAVLLITTAIWAYFGARVHRYNADQLINSYLFESRQVFSQAFLPGQHTFLIKWPILLLVKILGMGDSAYMWLTVLTVEATVASFAYILYKIDSRQLYFGTLCLMLASVLLLVPAAPYGGGLLPVNMAMLTTRNLEYLVYIVASIVLIRSRRFKSWQFWVAISLMAILVASDKLFILLSLGGALIGLVTFSLARGWNMVSFMAKWVVDSILALIFATIITGLINVSHITNVSSSGTGPYAVNASSHNIILGVIYGVSGILTNLGANPAFDSTALRSIPTGLRQHVFSASGVGYIVNLGIATLGFLSVWVIFKRSLSHNKVQSKHMDDGPTKLSVALLFSSVAACAGFIFSTHYYAADARYLTILLFTVFICTATYLRNSQFILKSSAAYKISLVLLAVIIASTLGGISISRSQMKSLTYINNRNQIVVNILKARNTKLLVGDYWRVVPTRQLSKNAVKIMPLSGCTTTRDILSSKAWQPNLKKTPFAYLLSFDKNLTDYPNCSIDQVVATYGRPNKSTVVAGSLDKPTELLLFYDFGSNQSPANQTNTLSTVLPIEIDDLPSATCPSPTIIQTVAHQDDDLLFMSPDLVNDVQAGHCVRTIYLTAGDAGSSSYYWLGREKGAEEAYSTMLKTKAIWIERTVKLKNNQLVTIANPRGNEKIQLVFFRLADGNINGNGFSGEEDASLKKLETKQIQTMKSVDKQSSYTYDSLSESLSELFDFYRPTEIRTQSTDGSPGPHQDHSDHNAVGGLTKTAYDKYVMNVFENKISIPLTYYMGYPIFEQPINVFGAEFENKEAAFLAYTNHDPAACFKGRGCWGTSTYREYLPRQYRADR